MYIKNIRNNVRRHFVKKLRFIFCLLMLRVYYSSRISLLFRIINRERAESSDTGLQRFIEVRAMVVFFCYGFNTLNHTTLAQRCNPDNVHSRDSLVLLV